MIKATEIRIGNFVDYKGKTYRICGTSEDFPFLDTIEHCAGGIDWKDLDETPLTEEWILRFGFKGKELTTDYLVFVKLSNSFYVKGMSGAVHAKQCDYVHQLQNLYFALTGEELEIKEAE